jgi:hypothetical protein
MKKFVAITFWCTVLAGLSCKVAFSAEDLRSEAAWQQLRQGTAIAIMRHALAPGTSDPSGFKIGDCATQRNLSEEGREQSRKIGRLFRQKGINAAQVISSEWCRCKDTASLLDVGLVNTLPALNSFFEDRSLAEPQTKSLKAIR